MSILIKAVAILSLLSLSACSVVPSSHGFAIIGDTTEAVTVSNATGTRMGKACGKNFLGLVATGDSSIAAAKRQGNITTVSSVDKQITRLLIMSEVCTIVRGR